MTDRRHPNVNWEAVDRLFHATKAEADAARRTRAQMAEADARTERQRITAIIREAHDNWHKAAAYLMLSGENRQSLTASLVVDTLQGLIDKIEAP